MVLLPLQHSSSNCGFFFDVGNRIRYQKMVKALNYRENWNGLRAQSYLLFLSHTLHFYDNVQYCPLCLSVEFLKICSQKHYMLLIMPTKVSCLQTPRYAWSMTCSLPERYWIQSLKQEDVHQKYGTHFSSAYQVEKGYRRLPSVIYHCSGAVWYTPLLASAAVQ